MSRVSIARFWAFWVASVEFPDNVGSMAKLLRSDPQRSFVHVLIAQPGHKIAESVLAVSVDFRVQNLLDFKLHFAINLDRGWRWLVATRKGIRVLRFQHRYMKDRVDTSHRVGESECEGDSTWTSYDLEWSQKLISEFLGWMGSANKLRSHEDLIANCEVGWSIPTSVRSSLVSLLSLGHGQLQFLMKGL